MSTPLPRHDAWIAGRRAAAIAFTGGSESGARVCQSASRAIRAGTVWVNTCRAVSCMSPFGGDEQRGIVRANAIEAMREFMRTKSAWISTAADVPNPFVTY